MSQTQRTSQLRRRRRAKKERTKRKRWRTSELALADELPTIALMGADEA